MKEAGFIAAGAVIAVGLTVMGNPVANWLFPPDPDEWLYIEAVQVPNFSLEDYEETSLDYIREVRKPFTGKYLVKAIMINPDGSEDPPAVCLGTDDFPYTIHPHDTMSMKVSTFIGPLRPHDDPRCFSKPGTYKLYVQWDMQGKGGERRLQQHTSNLFRVTK